MKRLCVVVTLAVAVFALAAGVADARTQAGATITIDNPSPVVEENGGVGGIVFTVTVAGDHPAGVTVNYRTVPNDATQGPLGTSCPTPGVDYLENHGTLIYLSGETIKTILVATCGDTLHENDETFAAPVRCSASPTELGVQDLVVVAVKAPAMAEVAKAIGPLRFAKPATTSPNLACHAAKASSLPGCT